LRYQREWQGKQPDGQTAQGMSGVVQWDGCLVDTFALSNGVGKFLNLTQKVLSLAIRKMIIVWNVANFSPQSIANPQGTILGAGDLLECSRCQQGPRQISTIDPTVFLAWNSSRFTYGCAGTAPTILVSFVACLYHLVCGFGKQETVSVIDFCVGTQTSASDVMSQQIRIGSNQLP